jgi:hypothetical protein
MNRARALARVALTVLLVGCDSYVDPASDAASEVEAWIEVGTTRFQTDGESGSVVIPAPAPCVGVALRATTEPGVCFQLSAVVDGEGRAVIDERSAGAFCRDCALRSSVAVEAGVFLLPAEAGGFAPETGLSLRFARVDCVTLTPLTGLEDRPTLRVEAQPIEVVPDHATIDLRFHIARSSILFGDEARQQELIATLGQALASGGLTPRLVETHELDALPPDDLRFHAGDHAALAAWIAQFPPKNDETTLDIVFGGCLRYDDPIFGPPSAVNGFTPRIPGGAGPADGVFMPGLDCFAEGSGPVEFPVGAQARVLAHEIGHYLGLYHVIEADGLADQLDDTGPDNVMHPNPELATAVGFSPSQGRVMRMHPAARGDGDSVP